MLFNHKQTNNIPSGSKPVGAVTSSAHIKEVNDENDASFIVGAVMPSAVLGSGSETEEEVSAPLLHISVGCAP